MTIIFSSPAISLYREGADSYLKNGTTNKIPTVQANSIISKLHGLTDDAAEKLILDMYENGEIETEKKYDMTNIYPNGNGFQVRLSVDKVRYTKHFHKIEEAVNYRDRLRGGAGHLKNPESKERLGANLEKIITHLGLTRYQVKGRKFGKCYYKRFTDLTEAIKWRDDVRQTNQANDTL